MSSCGIVIPAHMNSTRFPGKPLTDVGGRPLLLYAVEAARESGLPWYVATSDDAIYQWCKENGIENRCFVTPEFRNGTERSAFVNKGAQWDRVIVLQCDEPDVCGEYLRWLSLKDSPCTITGDPSRSDWGNPNSVFVGLPDEVSGEIPEVALYFRRAVEDESEREHERHVGVYLYDAKMLDDYLHHPPTPAEESQSLEQLRTMAMGYTWHIMRISVRLRSVNVPADVEAFK